jgi:hypothetical protein
MDSVVRMSGRLDHEPWFTIEAWRRKCDAETASLDDPRLHNGYDISQPEDLKEHLLDWPNGCPACQALRRAAQII